MIDFENKELLYKAADTVRRQHYGNKVYIRGLIEISNICKNDCYYCGIRCSNKNVTRYRLTKDEILSCCKRGYELDFRTFVLQGGEDSHYTDKIICEIVSNIKELFPDTAVTLSIGEKSKSSYKAYFDAGADRYLLRHETADDVHYKKLHPESMSLKNRKKCLFDLKEIGYQVGSGFMVGSPYQTDDNLMEDLKFLGELSPDMIGIGPYITHKDTPFCNMKSGTLEKTLEMVAILRLMFPYALIPSTTALATIHPDGRKMGLMAGANVVMPNLSPNGAKENYTLYENKLHTGSECGEGLGELKAEAKSVGYEIVTDIGNVKR